MRSQRVLLAVLLAALALILAVNLGAGSDPAPERRARAEAGADLVSASRSGALLGGALAHVAPSVSAERLAPVVAASDRRRRVAAQQARAARKARAMARRERAATRRQAEIERTTEVWQRPESPYDENPDNPLAGRVWGVYRGNQDQVSSAYDRASADERSELDAIMARPRTKWYGSFVPDGSIRSSVASYIASSQNGDPSTLVQFAVFRMSRGSTRPADDRRRRRSWTPIGGGSTRWLRPSDPPRPWW